MREQVSSKLLFNEKLRLEIVDEGYAAQFTFREMQLRNRNSRTNKGRMEAIPD